MSELRPAAASVRAILFACSALAGCSLLAAVHAQAPAPPVPAAFPGPPPPPLGRKLQELLALRAILALHLTAQDIDAALPPLRAMEQADHALHSQAEQEINRETQALLAAGPDAPPPPDSSLSLAQDLAQYRKIRETLWHTISAQLGAGKAAGLRRVIGEAMLPELDSHHPGPLLQEKPGTGLSPQKLPSRQPSAPLLLEAHLPLPDFIALLQQKRALMPH